jgi:hypothetical protein
MTNYDILKEYEAHQTPVPSYEELENMNEAVNQAIAANIKLVERVKQLEGLLKECFIAINEGSFWDECDVLQKIDKALGEDK